MIFIFILLTVLFIGLLVIILYQAFMLRRRSASLLSSAQEHAEIMRREIELERRDALAKLKEELYKKKVEASSQLRKEQIELDKLSSTLLSKTERLTEREKKIDETQKALQQTERTLSRLSDQIRVSEQKMKLLNEDITHKLETISCMTKEEARKALLKTLEEEVTVSHKKWLQKVEEEARFVAKDRAAQIIVEVMQRHVSEHAAVYASGVVHLPSEDMKGRIIGKEGRNIKALEMATGMEFLVDNSVESITISGFNPIRREIARKSLERLMLDGRINPARIEETVQQCEQEIEQAILDYGKQALLACNVHGVKEEMTILLGKLYFRTSFSQNVLDHSIEVARFARMIAEELGLARPDIALRAGLFHDIGKALSADIEGTHALLGAEVARRCGEDPLVVNAIAAHHEEVPCASIYSLIVVIADGLSAARPGARRETLSTYIKRLEKLEHIAQEFEGVKRAYALQAGREIRVFVEEAVLNDEQAYFLARNIARRIEKDLAFPGQIKVQVIRETRAIEYAR